jgi:hypothetical protein
MQLVVEMAPAGVARAQGLCTSTVTRWTERAAQQARRFDEEHLKLDEAVELQLDELNSHGAGERDPAWVFGAIEVRSRVWAVTRVGRRTLRTTLVFLRRLRAVLRTRPHPSAFLPALGRVTRTPAVQAGSSTGR